MDVKILGERITQTQWERKEGSEAGRKEGRKEDSKK